MARGTYFGGLHSNQDLRLIQQRVDVQPALPKLNIIDIPGADGSKDLSAQPGGRVVFTDREITWTFALYPGDNWHDRHRRVSNALNGLACHITLDDDPEYYYVGRLSVDSYNIDGLLRQITVRAICRPFKLKQEETRVFVPFCGKNLLDVSESNQLAQLYGSVEYIAGGVRKSGRYFVGYRVFVKPNTLYFLSVNVKKITEASQPGNGGRIAIYDKDVRYAVSSFSTTEGSSARSFNSGEHSEVTVLLYSDSDADQGVYEFTNLQMEPDRATAYEPFTAIPEKEITLMNDRKPVVPTITCTGETTLRMLDGSVTLNAGTHKVLDFQLEEGETTVTLVGAGAAHIIYQEGAL